MTLSIVKPSKNIKKNVGNKTFFLLYSDYYLKMSDFMKKCIVFLISFLLITVISCSGSKNTVKETGDTPTARDKISVPDTKADKPEEVRKPELPVEKTPKRDETRHAEPVPVKRDLNLKTIYFDFDRFDIRPDAKRTLIENARILQESSDISFLIEGHCDERGTLEYNLALGEKRAQSTRNFLIIYGIASSRITTISYGEEKPADFNHNERAWARNRRCAFVLKE